MLVMPLTALGSMPTSLFNHRWASPTLVVSSCSVLAFWDWQASHGDGTAASKPQHRQGGATHGRRVPLGACGVSRGESVLLTATAHQHEAHEPAHEKEQCAES